MCQSRRPIYYFVQPGFFAIFPTLFSKKSGSDPLLPGTRRQYYRLGLIAAVAPPAGVLFSFPTGVIPKSLHKKPLLNRNSIPSLTQPPNTPTSQTRTRQRQPAPPGQLSPRTGSYTRRSGPDHGDGPAYRYNPAGTGDRTPGIWYGESNPGNRNGDR